PRRFAPPLLSRRGAVLSPPAALSSTGPATPTPRPPLHRRNPRAPRVPPPAREGGLRHPQECAEVHLRRADGAQRHSDITASRLPPYPGGEPFSPLAALSSTGAATPTPRRPLHRRKPFGPRGSPPAQEGWLRHQQEDAEVFLSGADGVVRKADISASLTTRR